MTEYEEAVAIFESWDLLSESVLTKLDQKTFSEYMLKTLISNNEKIWRESKTQNERLEQSLRIEGWERIRELINNFKT